MQVIEIHSRAPGKPAPGAPCNGCGICCLAEPCPLGAVLSLSLRGACSALRWDAVASRYVCGAIVDPHAALAAIVPRRLQGMVGPLAAALARIAPRWIAAGIGCDSTLQPLDPSATMR